MQMVNPLDPLHPGDAATGESVAAHAAAMKELNPKTPMSAPSAAPSTSMKPAAVDKINPKGRYGDRSPEKRIDTADWTKNLGDLPKYHKGVDSVPKTGPAVLKKGEKVVKAEDNSDNPDNAVDAAFDGDKDMKMSESKKKNVSLHRAIHDLNKGGLHRALGVPEGQDIPKDKIEAARNSSNEHLAHMANFAHTLARFKKK